MHSPPLSLRDIEALAAARLEPAVYDYFAGGALDEETLRANEMAFLRRRLRPRVLVDVSTIDTSTEVLGKPVSMPIGIAPSAQHRLACEDGELAAARAAAAAGIIFCASCFSSCPLEEIASAGGRRWFQLYVQRDRALSESLISRAQAAGYEALVLTVDTPVPSRRERDMRFERPVPFSYGNFEGLGPITAGISTIGELLDPSMTWDDVAWLRSASTLPVVLKGIATAEDARLAIEHGVEAIYVSNHGGRQLDRAVATLDALEEIARAVDGKAELYVDGGARRGVDVVTALALGARAVFFGRPIIYAAAWDGEQGVATALTLLGDELANAMALLGTPDVRSVTRAHVTADA